MTNEITKEQMTNYLMRGMAARALINKREFTDEEAAAHNAILNLIEASGEKDGVPDAPDKTLMRLAADLGVSFSAAKIIHDHGQREAAEYLAEIDAHLTPSPAHLPKEAEAAMARMPDAILCAYAFRLGHTRATIPSVSEATYDNEADEAALALIQAALRPKVVTRRWVETLAFSVANEHQDDCDELIREWLRDLGIEVGP
jgi:hypothetical protein